MNGEPAAGLGRHAHAAQKVQHSRAVHGSKSLRAANGQERSDSGVGGGQVGQLAGAAAKAASGVLAGGEEGDDVGLRRAAATLPTAKGGLQQCQAVQRPVADPGAARVQRHKAARQPSQRAAQVSRVLVAGQRQRVLPALPGLFACELLPQLHVAPMHLAVQGRLLHRGVGDEAQVEGHAEPRVDKRLALARVLGSCWLLRWTGG
mmetsp:Transcript_44522/g.112650  ORF Transcript_44522/g.112650 Transcript_44522/m.112650 type:complete len:205 (+) Transcript_44522:585-1199(+)